MRRLSVVGGKKLSVRYDLSQDDNGEMETTAAPRVTPKTEASVAMFEKKSTVHSSRPA
jgi:hypothetical protein